MRSFDLVDEKLTEADFFFEKLANCEIYEIRFFFSAFVSSARSVTFALQSVMSDAEGFQQWYKQKQKELKADPIAKFFHKVRTESQHIGINPVNQGTHFKNTDGKLISKYYFSYGINDSVKDIPQTDVVSTCKIYLTKLVNLIHNCYIDFGPTIDPMQYYTLENIHRLGLSIEDIEESLGLPRGWTKIDEDHDEDRMRVLRDSVPGPQISWIFEKYSNE
ncbi:MAG: hypothetical protein HY863_09935 [Chloroflexi bacterium]|nr:hypothetical protein [Chloroflexota bacterium]